MPPGGQIHKSILLKCRTQWLLKIAIHCVCKLWKGTMILQIVPIFWHVTAPWWPNTEINMTEMLYPDRFHDLPFIASLQFIVHVNYEQEWWYLDFFQYLDISMPLLAKNRNQYYWNICTQVDFMICHKFAIHCACKLWTGMIFRFFPIFRHIDAPWWPNTEINITEMQYPDTFNDLLQDCNSYLWTGTGTMILWFFSNF